MDPGERHAFALRGVGQVHDDGRLADLVTGHATQSWARTPYAFGEAAVYKARQLTRIEGSLESAIRVALEIDRARQEAATTE